MVDAVTAGGLATSNATLSGQSAKLSEDFDDFLILLTTQMQNQDPLSPMDSTEFTNQLVQFSGVEQQINMNEKLNQMLALQLASTSTVALGYVGMDVAYIGDLFYAKGGEEYELNYALEDDAVSTKIHIKDPDTGNVVRTLEGDTSAGNHKIVWDGLDDNGQPVEDKNYRISVDSLDINDEAIETSTAVSGRVTGIETVNGVIQLLLEGDALVSVNSVINAREPKKDTQETADTGNSGEDNTEGETDETDAT